MILYDKTLKIGDLNNIDLLTGKSYTLIYDISFEKFLGKTPKSQIVKYSGKTAVITSIGMSEGNRTAVTIIIPGENPFPILVLIYGLSALFVGIGVYLASTNVVKVVENVTKPSSVLGIGFLAFLYFKFFAK